MVGVSGVFLTCEKLWFRYLQRSDRLFDFKTGSQIYMSIVCESHLRKVVVEVPSKVGST